MASKGLFYAHRDADVQTKVPELRCKHKPSEPIHMATKVSAPTESCTAVAETVAAVCVRVAVDSALRVRVTSVTFVTQVVVVW